jgi:hypothetical protein
VNKEIVREWRDLGYYLIMEEGDNECFADFKVYKIVDDKELVFQNKYEDVSFPTTKVEDAEVFVSGSLRWDGCCNFNFDCQDDCMIHTCEREELLNIGVLLSRIWDLGREVISGWNP